MGKNWAYARISDQSQKIDSQIDLLEKAGVDEIVQETITGISKEKKLYKLIEELQAGDTLTVARADRLARNTIQIIKTAEKLNEKGVDLVILDLNIDTRTPTGRMLLTIMAALSQWERDQLKEKQKNGIDSALKRGIKFGPKPHFEEEGLETAIRMYDSGDYTVDYICKTTNVSRATLYRKLKKRK